MARKILFVSYFAEILGGGEKRLIQNAKKLEEKGFECLILVPREGSLSQACQEEGLETVTFPLYTFSLKNPKPYFKTVKKVIELVKREDIGLIVSNTMYGIDFCGLPSKLCGLPSLCFVRCIDFPPHHHVSRMNYALTDRVLCVSDATRENLERKGLKNKKLKTFHTGIDLTEFQQKRRDNVLREEFKVKGGKLVGWAGYLVARKHPDKFIQAASQVLKSHPNAHFFLIGGGNESFPKLPEQLKGLVRELGIEKNVHFTGHRADMPAVMQALDIFVAPYEKEPFAGTILEALATATPVIAFDDGGAKDIILQGKNGFLVEKNSQALAEKICYLFDNPEKMEAISQTAFQTSQSFTLEPYIRRLLKEFQDIGYKF